MEKEIDKSAVVLKEEENVGVVQIADDVVATIAALATAEVKGVSVVSGNAGKMGVKKSRGVRVELLNGTVRVDLAVVMDYGLNIPAISRQVQSKVKAAIENMTGLQCTDVNIRIAAVKMN